MKYAIVTGGSRGIGRQIVQELARAGLFVAFTYRGGKEEAEALEQFLNVQGLESRAVRLDITDYEGCRNFVSELYKEMGPPEILVNNAGINADAPLFSMDKRQWDDVIDTNLNGLFNLTQQAAFHMMKAKKGRIVNVSSIAGITGVRGQCNYSAAKAAILGFTKALAKEAAPFGVAVNALAPGGVETDMTANMKPEALEKLIDGIPARRQIA